MTTRLESENETDNGCPGFFFRTEKFLRKTTVEPDKPLSSVIPKALMECINVLNREDPEAFWKITQKNRRDSHL